MGLGENEQGEELSETEHLWIALVATIVLLVFTGFVVYWTTYA